MRPFFPQLSFRHSPFLSCAFTLLILNRASFAEPNQGAQAVHEPAVSPPISLAQLKHLIGPPTLITFSGKDVPIAAISKIFLPHADPQKLAADAQPPGYLPSKSIHTRVDVNWKQDPFWVAARESENLTGMHWDSQAPWVGLSPESRRGLDKLAGIVASKDPYVEVVLGGIAHHEASEFLLNPDEGALPKSSREIVLLLTVFLDPKLPFLTGEVRAHQVTTELSDIPSSDLQMVLGGVDNIFKVPTQIYIDLPPISPGVTLLHEVKGMVSLKLQTASTTFKVPDIEQSSGVPLTLGTQKITLKNYTLDNNEVHFQMEVVGANLLGTPASDYREDFSRVRLRDAQGHEIHGGGGGIEGNDTSDGKQQVIADLGFGNGYRNPEKLKGPFSLEWEIPTKTRTYEVPFELHDITVP